MMWGWRGRHGRWGQYVETTDHGDHMGTFWGLWGQHEDDGDDGDNVGRMCGWHGWCGDDRDNMWQPQTMETTWGPSGGYGDNMRTTKTMWGWRGRWGPHGDNKITKNAITFEQIEIIEFRLKIWDPWALPHTCRLQLMCRWGGVLSQMAFLSKKCSSDPRKNFFPVFALDPIRP